MEDILSRLIKKPSCDIESRVLAGRARNEDAAVVQVLPNKALVQTVDILAPIVNDPYTFGRIAAANALSDVYAMGGEPWCAMNMLFFPTACNGEQGMHCAAQILRGGLDTLTEAGAALVGGHTVEDAAIKYGMSVTGLINPDAVATNDGLREGDILFLTKPLGTGILATGIKAKWDNYEHSEALVSMWCAKLNTIGSRVVPALGLKAATDITGFGLGGHALEMALASQVSIELDSESVPLLDNALVYARDGLIPSASHANRKYWQAYTSIAPTFDKSLESIIFDTQTSGGLLLAVPEEKVNFFQTFLANANESCWRVGRVVAQKDFFLYVL